MRPSKYLRLPWFAGRLPYLRLFAPDYVRDYSENGGIVIYAEGWFRTCFIRCRLSGLFHSCPL